MKNYIKEITERYRIVKKLDLYSIQRKGFFGWKHAYKKMRYSDMCGGGCTDKEYYQSDNLDKTKFRMKKLIEREIKEYEETQEERTYKRKWAKSKWEPLNLKWSFKEAVKNEINSR